MPIIDSPDKTFDRLMRIGDPSCVRTFAAAKASTAASSQRCFVTELAIEISTASPKLTRS